MYFSDRNPQRQTLFEKSLAPLLVLCGEEDKMSLEYSRFAVNRALKSGNANLALLEYPETGHLIDLPHCPHVKEATHPLLPPTEKIQYGGKSQPHALAQFQAWDDLLTFFKENM